MKHVLCSLVYTSEFLYMAVFNVVIKQNYKLPYNWSKMQLRRYNYDRLVVQYWSVTSTANEMLLAFRTNAFFVLPDTIIVATGAVNIFQRMAVK
jgi:hypothetical protein